MSEPADSPDSLDARAARVLERLGDADDDRDAEQGEEEGGNDAREGGADTEPPRPKSDAVKEAGEGDEDAIAPPVSWSSEEKETFRSLPRDAQAVIARREGERDRLLSQRAQDIAQRGRALEELRRGYAQRLDAFIAQARALDPLLGEGTQEDWAKLARENPAAFVQRMTAVQQRSQQLAAAQSERQRIAEEHNRDYIAREFQQLNARVPEFRDAAQRQALLNELGSFLGEAGFTKQELGGLADHRTYLVALDAMRYRKLMKAQKDAAGKKVVAASKVQKPGAAQEGEPRSTRLAALKKAARRTGKLDDRAAYVLAALRDV